MASVFGHAAAALALGSAFRTAGVPGRFWALGVACAVLPDIDVVAFSFGISSRHVLGHRGLTHSVLFAVGVGTAVAWLFVRGHPWRRARWRLAAYFVVATASHGVLDAMTNGGPGVAFFAPIDDTRFFLPWRPIVVSPIGLRPFLGEWGLAVVKSELRWVLIPSVLFALAVGAWRWSWRKRHPVSAR
jgi:inner membrane protein